MSNSVFFKHPDGLITTSNEHRLFVKTDDKWVESTNFLYKSEIQETPSSDLGKNGDYYAYYVHKYNEIPYSENFSKDIWHKENVTLKKETHLVLPYNNPTIVYPSLEKAKHTLRYYFANTDDTYTFSLYFISHSKLNMQLMLSDNNETTGYKVRFNYNESDLFGDTDIQDKITDEKFGEEMVQNCNHSITKISSNAFRLSVSAKIINKPTIKATIQLLDKNLNEEFLPDDISYGMWINGAQLDKNPDVPLPYIYNDGEIIPMNTLGKLYIKVDSQWDELENNKVWYSKDIPSNKLGENGDICCYESLLGLEPYVRFGKAKDNKDEGVIFYDPDSDKWFVNSIKNGKTEAYELMYKNASTFKHDMAMALTLNQHTYHTYNGQGRYSHRHGLNTGGNVNFWNRIKYGR